MTAEAIVLNPRPVLSVIMPVYNERMTIRTAIERVLNASTALVDRQLIIVLSPSTDGSDEIVQSFRFHDAVRIVVTDVARGKGHAVRAGLAVASGEIVLIQDADLEYDTADYDAVIEPIASGREAFVLGSRHTGNWKVRTFVSQPLAAAVLNAGHVLFTSYVNVLCGVRLRDPFTMYKVFRRECLNGIHFRCNGFDFDFELVIKLIRRGFTPVEIPVNYVSRSFHEGKKVRMFRDPWSWVVAGIRSRFGRL